MSNHRIHSAEVLAAGNGHQHAEDESVAADRQQEDNQLDADLGADECFVATCHRRPQRVTGVDVIRNRLGGLRRFVALHRDATYHRQVVQ